MKMFPILFNEVSEIRQRAPMPSKGVRSVNRGQQKVLAIKVKWGDRDRAEAGWRCERPTRAHGPVLNGEEETRSDGVMLSSQARKAVLKTERLGNETGR